MEEKVEEEEKLKKKSKRQLNKDMEDSWNRFTEESGSIGCRKMVPGEFAYMDTRTGAYVVLVGIDLENGQLIVEHNSRKRL